MLHQSTPSQAASARCTSCGSHKVVAMESIGDSPVCLRHRALELGGREVQQELVLELLDQFVLHVVEYGQVNPDDVAEAVADACRVASDNRRRGGNRPVPTVADTAVELLALAEYDQLDQPQPAPR